MDGFIDKTKKQLKLMTENEKDAWIISQARILPVWKQEDFYKSICGTKIVIDMPGRGEISEFCQKVRNGEITVEYETHYVEFDDSGHFHDRWMHDYHDPDHAMTFILSVIRGCHDLIVLEDYKQAFEILDEILGVEITIVDHPNTDDNCKNEFMNLNMAVREGILPLDRNELLRDYIESCKCGVKDTGCAAEKIAGALEMDLFKYCETSSCITITEKDPLLTEIKKKLKESFLRGTWSQITDLIFDLMDEPYIDDQYQIGEIWNIVEALLKRGGFEKEPWEVKESILKEIYDNNFYEYYGICDPMMDLADAICTTREENLKRAGIMMKAGRRYLGAEAAKLYRELGEEDKCAEYFENHLGKDEEPYEILIDHYKDRDHEKAVEIATLAIQKCQEDQTPFFIFLLQDAKNRGDEAAYRKLMQSAHRRRAVKSAEVDERFSFHRL